MNKSMKPQAAAKPLSEQEKKMQIARYLTQKREQFAINILCNLVRAEPAPKPDTLVGKAVEMADLLMEKLYHTEETKQE